MRSISVNLISERIAQMVQDINFNYPADIKTLLDQAAISETSPIAKQTLTLLQENARIAHDERIPICQDTGMVIIFIKIGQDVHLIDGDLNTAINVGVAKGYQDGYLRKSVVDDPLFERINTKNNTPCIIYSEIVKGEQVEITLGAKGFGSENMSANYMLKPAQGVKGVKEAVIKTIKKAGPNACPPMVVGVGIGGTFDYSAVLAKKATLRDCNLAHPDARYAALEQELLSEANKLNIGPQCLKGDTSVLKINIETAPTHIAGLPVSVNISCHVTRHAKEVI